MPLTNGEIGTYYLRGYGNVEGGVTSYYGEIDFSIVKNCSVESLTPPGSVSDIAYTFHSTAINSVLPETTSSRPVDCPVTHLLYSKQSDNSWKEVTDVTSEHKDLVSYVSGTRTSTVFYDVDNRFS